MGASAVSIVVKAGDGSQSGHLLIGSRLLLGIAAAEAVTGGIIYLPHISSLLDDAPASLLGAVAEQLHEEAAEFIKLLV